MEKQYTRKSCRNTENRENMCRPKIGQKIIRQKKSFEYEGNRINY